MHAFNSLLLLGLLSSVPLLAADEPAVATSETPAGDVDLRKEASTYVAAGNLAMRDADTDPKRAVDSALSFSHALKTYEKLGDVDAICEMQANIYWCKKRMNLDNLGDYIAKKGADAQVDLSRVKEIITKEVPVEEAQTYFERAKKFQQSNPDKHFQIAIRFSEVLERFPDTEAAKLANSIFAKEQTAYMTQVAEERKKEQAENQKERDLLKQEREQIRTSRFMNPPQVSSGATTKVPDKAAQEKSLATLKKLYAEGYKKKKDGQKRTLARKLFEEAAQSKDDAALYYVMLDESTRLARESEDYEQLLSSIEKMAETYEGFDQLAYKRSALAIIKSKPTAAAILKLLDDPKDKTSNSTVGKFFCFNMGRWDLGLTMLSLGSDADIAKVAEMEIGNPKEPQEKRATGDAWYDAGKKSSGADKNGMWQRAQFWYSQALPGLTGAHKERVTKAIEEIDKVLPPIITDYDNITPHQWDKLKGTTVAVDAKLDRADSGVTFAAKKKYRVVPHPTDKWSMTIWDEKMECDYKGEEPFFFSSRRNRDGKRLGALLCQLGNGDWVKPGVLEGPGHLYFVANTNSWGADDRKGTIRVKILPVADDD
ncbi:MAG: hypothetical protein H0V44_05170 [Planctomycetes bacterium]|nr:hypothetical protein [Planctomycetota bacterium]